MDSERILILEDNLETAEGIKDGLERAGFRVSVVGRGEDAIATMRDPAIALAVLDINLPTISGREVLRRLREQGDHRPIILITQNADPLEELMAIDAEGAEAGSAALRQRIDLAQTPPQEF